MRRGSSCSCSKRRRRGEEGKKETGGITRVSVTIETLSHITPPTYPARYTRYRADYGDDITPPLLPPVPPLPPHLECRRGHVDVFCELGFVAGFDDAGLGEVALEVVCVDEYLPHRGCGYL